MNSIQLLQQTAAAFLGCEYIPSWAAAAAELAVKRPSFVT
jgi:hypothetical protein